MHIAGIIKQVSLLLGKKLRNVASALLRNTLLRDPIVTINGLKYYLSDARLESFSSLSTEYEKYVWEYFKPATGDVFIDIGVYVGKYALQVAKNCRG
jgi:hypothetical protein